MTRSATERRAIDVIEEAFHLLRQAPAGSLAVYYLATLPFVLALLYFWADMSQSAFAPARCAEAALGVTWLYLGMKCGQAIFVAELNARLRGEPPPRWTVRRLWRLAVTQIAIQPTGLFLLPLALLAAVPFAWVYAFYHQVTAVGDGTSGEPRVVARQAARLARLWPRQNHGLLLIVLGFGFFVLANVAMVLALAPQLLRMFLGIETTFTLSGQHVLNSTFLATVMGVTYLCLNPLIKTIYLLRTFYGEAIHSGADLLAELKMLRLRAARIAMMVGLLWITASHLTAAPSPSPPVGRGDRLAVSSPREGEDQGEGSGHSPGIAAGSLDEAIDRVLQRREFIWRMPDKRKKQDLGLIATMLEGLLNQTRAVFRAIERGLRFAADWLRRTLGLDRRHWSSDDSSNGGWIAATRVLVATLTAAVLGALVVFAWRVWTRRQRRPHVASALPVAALVVDVADENAGAEQLPVDGWLREAQDLLARRELRLALRAFYLAGLAQLAARELIVLARSKSNREYRRELERRAHAAPGVTEAFVENVGVFERVWYGDHAVTVETIEKFRGNLLRMQAG